MDAAKKNGISKNEVIEEENLSPPEAVKQEKEANVVIVPQNISSQEAKKFRKEARRKARAEGKEVSVLEFVVEGSKPKGSSAAEESENNNHNKKKRKRDFPSLNDLVKEEAAAKSKKQSLEAKNLAEDALTDEYKSRYLALDCEMVGIGTDGKKSALARVSIVDWNGKVVLDTFVQVPTRVTDFRTFVSGVTAKDIQKGSGAMKESECREKVANILRHKVLVGHALKNDFQALLLTHPKGDIRDTAKYRPFQRLGGGKYRPRKLRDLAKEHLDLSIQQQGQSHDSVQDAWAAMQLFRLERDKWEQELEEKSAKKRKTH